MSTSTKKKSTQKVAAPVAKYRLGQKAYYIFYMSTAHQEILEAEVQTVRTFQAPVKDESGKTVRIDTCFQYDIRTGRGNFEVPEYSIYPSFFEVAKEFAKGFLFLLK